MSYVIETRAFAPDFDATEISTHALNTAKDIRGKGRAPAIVIHGIMKRSGTVYTGQLLGLHPHLGYTPQMLAQNRDLDNYPNQIWEIPFLPLTGRIFDLQREFFRAYEQNIGKIGTNDFLPLFGESFIAYLYSFLPEGQRMLLKMPGVQYLSNFYSLFPHENLLLIVRDGRDVVASTIMKWPHLRFSDVCRRWNRSAKIVLAFDEHYARREGYWLARFEDAVRDPDSFVDEACERFGLNSAQYPFESIESIPVIGSSAAREAWIQKPRGFTPVGRWRQWTAKEKRVFKRVAGEALMALGYCDDLDW